MLTVSQGCLDYLILERRWLRSGRPEEIVDQLDHLWYVMKECDNVGDVNLLSNRGPIINDDTPQVDFDPRSKSGYCFKLLDAFEAQISRRYQNG